MSSPIRHLPGFGAPAVGFEQPFAMLEACHERVQRSLDLLGRLRAHLRQQGADNDARQAARDVLRYFDMAAPLHHQDEELHVFPPLLASAEPDVKALVRRLQEDHARMAADWTAAREPLSALAEGAQQAFSRRDEAALDRFAARYADHVMVEEQIAYPEVRKLLVPGALDAMGREMAARRGVVN